ncbi:hypothetical protein HY948_01890 [Candidatus Gottesmanbacteria bacterium]|nr:hypothetical protein [Candidatus Gottesmanbacteria bacterium]
MIHCPNRDGFLKSYSTVGKNNLPITFARCSNCRGHWMNSFAANFLKEISVKHDTRQPDVRPGDGTHLAPLCPDCKAFLTRAGGDNIPHGIIAFRCPNDHGYFFPAGELTKFKAAQHAKLAYHTLWHIPLPSVASVLLAILAVIMLGSITAITATIQKKQSLQSNAQQLLVSQHALSPAAGTIFIAATTSIPAMVTVFISSTKTGPIPMESQNRTVHTTTITTLPPGIYEYFFTIFVNGKSVITDRYSIALTR